MFELTIANGIAWAVAAFYVVGAIGNWIAPPTIQADYSRWGYPGWFHYLTAVMEMAAAVMLFLPEWRIAGAVLGTLVMLGALATVLRHREFTHAIAPSVVAAFSILVGWLSL
ncbi:MAG: DoxX family protein [Brevundimonas sp.]|nr:MAG: DoxX family protein [Brevundimonas sp.]